MRFEVDGGELKRLRSGREKGATQKELAHELRISERLLREIENKDASVAAELLDRIARAFSVSRVQLCKQSQQVSPSGQAISAPRQLKERLVPRIDTGHADVVADEATLFDAAAKSQVVVLQVLRPLNQETEDYVAEIVSVASSLGWRGANRDLIGTPGELSIRKRMRELLVLLKGNDVWLYKTDNFKLLPERHTIPDEPDPFDCEVQLILAAGPPGEYGETSVQVAIDNGQPRRLRY